MVNQVLARGWMVARQFGSRRDRQDGVSDRATARLAAGARSLFSGHADVDHVVGLAERAGLARRVARLQPMAVIKG
jgi:RNA-splicing ligase RtcB